MPTRTVRAGETFDTEGIWIRSWVNPKTAKPPVTRQTRTWTNTYIGSSNPSYKEMTRRFSNATTNYTAEFQEWRTSPSIYTETTLQGGDKRYWESFQQGFQASPLDFGSAAASMVSRVQSQALLKLRADVRDTMTKACGPVALVEARKTIQMIRSPAASLMKQMVLYAQRMKRHKHYNDAKFLRDSYLEATFGWTPLVMEVAGMARAAAALQVDHKKTFQATERDEVQLNQTVVTTTLGKCGKAVETRRGSVEVSCRIRAGASGSIIGPMGAANSLATQTGFSFQEAPLALYELIPWSFVFDYFANVNGLLAAPYSAGGNFSWISTNTRVTRTVESSSKPVKSFNASYTLENQSTSPATITGKYVTLTRSGTLPNAEFSFHLPGSKALINMAALLAYR